MKLDKFILAQTMAFLISIPPQSNLAKLLNFCLSTQSKESSKGTKLLELTYDLMEHPAKLPYWTQDVMGHDLEYTVEEWQALGEMGIKNTSEFMEVLWQELDDLKL